MKRVGIDDKSGELACGTRMAFKARIQIELGKNFMLRNNTIIIENRK